MLACAATATAQEARPATSGNGAAVAAPVLVPPRLKTDSGADYPAEAIKDHVRATLTVTLVLEIDATGAVKKATVETPQGHGFDEAATSAAARLVFEPATRDGAAVPSRIKFRYVFPPPPPRLVGTVLRLLDDHPLVGATIIARDASGAEHTTQSDAEGHWTLSGLPPGTTHLRVVAEGEAPVESDEELEVGQETSVTLALRPAVVAPAPKPADPKAKKPEEAPEEVIVKGERPPREVTKRTLDQRELSRIPGTNGDALRALQNLPGVARSPGLRGELIIRGSAPDDTSVFVDGIQIPIVYHFGGLSSVIPTEMISKLDFYPGNFGAQYGRAMGGIVDVVTLSPRTDGKYHGIAQADFIDARMVAQGPIPLLDGWNFVVAGRRSYVDVWLKPLLERRGGGVVTAPVYYDWQAFAETHPTSTSRVRIGFYGSDDRLDFIRQATGGNAAASGTELSLHTGFARVQGSYDGDLGGGVKVRSALAYGYDVQSFDTGNRQFDQTLHPIQNRSEVSVHLAPGYTLHLGDDIRYQFSNVNVNAPPPRRQGQPDTGQANDAQTLTQNEQSSLYDLGFYSEMEMQMTTRLRLVPGFRADYASNGGHWDASPRLSARYAVNLDFPRTVLKGGLGIYHQPPQVRETSAVFGTPTLESNRAIHSSVGVEQELTRQIELSVEGFYKDLSNLVAPVVNPASQTRYDNLGSGYVIGSEVLLRYKPDARFFGWLAYTLSRSVRRDAPGQPQYLVPYDQTHILTVLGSYRIGGGWELGARFRYVSGDPYTPCDGAVQNGATSSYVCITGTRYSGRLPAFEELDLRVDKHWYYETWQLSAYLDLINAYNRANPEGVSYNYNYSQRLYSSGLPIIPSLGVRGEF